MYSLAAVTTAALGEDGGRVLVCVSVFFLILVSDRKFV